MADDDRGFALPPLLRQAGDALVAVYRGQPGFEAAVTASTALIMSGEDVAFHNWLIVTEAGAGMEEAFVAAVARLQARALPGYVYVTLPAAPTLGPACQALGVQPYGTAPYMTLAAAELRPLKLDASWRVDRIADSGTFRRGTEIFAEAFGFPSPFASRLAAGDLEPEPGLTFHGASKDGVLASVITTHRAGDAVYVVDMATAPASQRQGAGRALLGRVLKEYIGRGVTRFHLVASDSGLRLHGRFGFRTAEEGVFLFVPKVEGAGG